MLKDFLKLTNCFISTAPVHLQCASSLLEIKCSFYFCSSWVFFLKWIWKFICRRRLVVFFETWTHVRNWQKHSGKLSWYLCYIFRVWCFIRDMLFNVTVQFRWYVSHKSVHQSIEDTDLIVRGRICRHRMKRNFCTGARDKSWSGLYI